MPILMPPAISHFDLAAFHLKKQQSRFSMVRYDKIRFAELAGVPVSKPQRMPRVPAFWQTIFQCFEYLLLSPGVCMPREFFWP